MSEPATKEDVVTGGLLVVVVAVILFLATVLTVKREIKSVQPCRQVEVTKP